MEYFAIAQTAIPAILFVPDTQSMRTPLRAAPFLLCFVGLAWSLTRGRVAPLRRHPAWPLLVVVLVWLVAMLAHSGTSMVLGVAQLALYFSVIAPVLWVPVFMTPGSGQLRRLLWILLLCNGINATVGVLQVYDADRWLPKEFSKLALEQYGGTALSYLGPGGNRIVRPPGLFDTPGAACGPGAVAAILGLVFAIAPTEPFRLRILASLMAFLGITVIYLTHVRTNLVVVIISALSFSFLSLAQGKTRPAAKCMGVTTALLLGSLVLSVILGGDSVRERYVSLLQDDPVTVYYKNRGVALEYAFETLLFNYPLGAGLGRWGMIPHHFGGLMPDRSTGLLHAELQPNGWLLDGGLVLMVAYSAALLVSSRNEFRVALRAKGECLQYCCAAAFAANCGTVALVFSFVPFVTQVGIQYWFLAGAVFGAARTVQGRESRCSPG